MVHGYLGPSGLLKGLIGADAAEMAVSAGPIVEPLYPIT